MTLIPPFYTKTFLEMTEIYEYLHGNVRMSTQSVRAHKTQITRHTDQISRILQDQHPQRQTYITPSGRKRGNNKKKKKRGYIQDKVERCSNRIETTRKAQTG